MPLVEHAERRTLTPSRRYQQLIIATLIVAPHTHNLAAPADL